MTFWCHSKLQHSLTPPLLTYMSTLADNYILMSLRTFQSWFTCSPLENTFICMGRFGSLPMHKDSPSSARQCVPMTHMVSPDTCTCGGNLHSPENLFWMQDMATYMWSNMLICKMNVALIKTGTFFKPNLAFWLNAFKFFAWKSYCVSYDTHIEPYIAFVTEMSILQ